MTTTENNQKKKPTFHIFLEAAEGNRYAGSAYNHEKGNGFSFTIGGQRYVAFEPKSKPVKGESA